MSDKKRRELRSCDVVRTTLLPLSAPPVIPFFCSFHPDSSTQMSIRRHRALRGSSLFYSLFYPLAQSLRRLRSLDRGYPRHRHSVAPGLCAGWMVWRTHCHSAAPRLCAGCLVGTVWWTHRALRSSQTDFFLFSYLFPCFSCRMALYWFCLRSGFGKRQFLPFPPFFPPGHIILHT